MEIFSGAGSADWNFLRVGHAASGPFIKPCCNNPLPEMKPNYLCSIPAAKDEDFFHVRSTCENITMLELPALAYLLVAIGGAVGSVLRYCGRGALLALVR